MSIIRQGVVFALVCGIVFAPGGANAAPQPPAGVGPASSFSRLSGEIQVSSSSADAFLPAVAYNHAEDEYLVVWHQAFSSSFRQVTARRLNWMGQPLDDPTGVNSSGTNCYQPSVAYNGIRNEYLVVWVQDPDGSGTKNEIWGRICQFNSSSTGCNAQDFLIMKWANRSFWSPRAAWSSGQNEYLVVWNAVDSSSGLSTDIGGYRLTYAGQVIESGFPLIFSDVGHPHQVSLVYNQAVDEYLVVWRHMASVADGDIYGRRLRGDGGFEGPAFAIYAPAEDQRAPVAAVNQVNRYLVAWQQGMTLPSFNWDIYAQELDNTGHLIGGATPLAYSAQNEMAPAAAAVRGVGRDYLIAWERAAPAGVVIEGERWSVNHRPLELAATAFWDNEKPALAVGATGFFIGYESDAVGDPTVSRGIAARIWWPGMAYLPLVTRK